MKRLLAILTLILLASAAAAAHLHARGQHAAAADAPAPLAGPVAEIAIAMPIAAGQTRPGRTPSRI